jgi:hypothetical protein
MYNSSVNIAGKKIDKVTINSDQTAIKIYTGNEVIMLRAIGDCCSHSWFNHIQFVSNLTGSTITKLKENPELETEHSDSDSECIRVYSHTIFTDKGVCTFELRNSSNGYYGGYVDVDIYPLDQDNTQDDKELTQDF